MVTPNNVRNPQQSSPEFSIKKLGFNLHGESLQKGCYLGRWRLESCWDSNELTLKNGKYPQQAAEVWERIQKLNACPNGNR